MRIATIDIGTNSVLLTIAEPNKLGEFIALHEDARITRIGQGLVTKHAFLPEAMNRTANVLHAYVSKCAELNVEKIITVGTAAFRRALNAKAFVADVQQNLGLNIEIISGEREAELSYLAAKTDFDDELLVIDIGGGSTEFIWRTQDVREPLAVSEIGSGQEPPRQNLKAVSLPLGSVVLHERLVQPDPINDADYAALQTYILTELLTLQGSSWGGNAAAMPQVRPPKLVALAGTATTLAAMKLKLIKYSHADVHGMVLTLEELTNQLQILRESSVAQKKEIPGIEPERADVVLEGAVLLHETMKLFEYDEVVISDRGVRWGLIYEMEA